MAIVALDLEFWGGIVRVRAKYVRGFHGLRRIMGNGNGFLGARTRVTATAYAEGAEWDALREVDGGVFEVFLQEALGEGL